MIFRALFILCVFSLALASGRAEEPAPKQTKSYSPIPSQWWKTRPVRQDTPLRPENITDREVSEIQGVLKELYPGSVVYISAVTTECPCEDGPYCTDQVWSVAARIDDSNELALSRIDGTWQVGPLQKWWLVRDRLWQMYKDPISDSANTQKIDYREYQKRLMGHIEAFPTCTVELSADDA